MIEEGRIQQRQCPDTAACVLLTFHSQCRATILLEVKPTGVGRGETASEGSARKGYDSPQHIPVFCPDVICWGIIRFASLPLTFRKLLFDNLDLDCNAPSNILFMQKKIEAAFDNFEITVLPVHHKVFLLKKSPSRFVAFEYRSDADMTAAGGSTSSGKSAKLKKVMWGEFYQKKLSAAGINQPSDAALFVHAQRAFMFAVKQGWVNKSEVPALCYGDNEILCRFLADADSTSSGSGAGGDQGGATGSDLGESSQLPELEGVGDV
ncbi:hypothetical protein VaNZ11_016019 [Volvox africanus]|uniref:HNH nuclease domain-containing protein n=1 Tax=Volvox africanus TaxID=51714 RepID=A0ABQ5SP83_9CHLO|nr:hypothetical protein VaNZ11_016019 [Volvox africanus]